MTDFRCLGGTLLRAAAGWEWRDGSPEPRVSDLRQQQCYNFRCRTYGCGTTLVEVLLAKCHSDDDLHWVRDGWRSGKYGECLSGDHTGPTLLTISEHYESGDIPGISEPTTRVSAEPTRADGGKRAIPRVVLVPIADWDAWAATVCGATWDKADESDILATARRLGWTG